MSDRSTSTKHLPTNGSQWEIVESLVERLAPKGLPPIAIGLCVTRDLASLLYQAKSYNAQLVIKTRISQLCELSSFHLTLFTPKIQGRDNLYIPATR